MNAHNLFSSDFLVWHWIKYPTTSNLCDTVQRQYNKGSLLYPSSNLCHEGSLGDFGPGTEEFVTSYIKIKISVVHYTPEFPNLFGFAAQLGGGKRGCLLTRASSRTIPSSPRQVAKLKRSGNSGIDYIITNGIFFVTFNISNWDCIFKLHLQ